MATIELGGHLWICEDERGNRHLYLNTQRLVGVLPHCDLQIKGAVRHVPDHLRLLVNYGPVGITIKQPDTPEDEALTMLEENDAGTWTPPEALVIFGKDIEAAKAILRADCEAHGGVWDESWFARPSWMPKPQSEPDMKEGHDG